MSSYALDVSRPLEFEFMPEVEVRLVEIAGGTFSGKILEKDRQLVDAVLGAHASGIGKERIAGAFHISKNSVRGIIERARESGKIDPYKKHVSKSLGRAIESGIERWSEAVEEGNIRPDQIPVAVGIFFDKKQLLDGEVTSRVERVAAPSVDDVLAKMERARAVLAGGVIELPVDDQSTDFDGESLQKANSKEPWCDSGADSGPAGALDQEEGRFGSEDSEEGRGGVLRIAGCPSKM